MSDTTRNDPDTRKAVDEFARMLRQKSEEEREALLRQARDEALAEELAERREESEREAAALLAELAHDPGKERARARETAKSAALLLIMLLLILLLIAAATGRSDILQFSSAQAPQKLEPAIGPTDTSAFNTNSRAATSVAEPPATISPLFAEYYQLHGGKDVFGLPVSNERQEDGVTVQWFQRARLEYWPNNPPEYQVLGSLMGVKYMASEKVAPFPTQVPFISQERILYFPQTGHGLADPFVGFWTKYDGPRVLGFPISDQLQEQLPDGHLHTVQYFERGRLEYHPENTDVNQQVQLGLLGQGIYANPDHVRIIAAPTPVAPAQPLAPTPVPPAG